MNNIKSIANQLLVNTQNISFADEGVYDPKKLLEKIVTDQDQSNTAFLCKALQFLVENNVDCKEYGIHHVWDNTINGDDKEIYAFLIIFAKKTVPQKEFSLHVEGDDVSIWEVSQ